MNAFRKYMRYFFIRYVPLVLFTTLLLFVLSSSGQRYLNLTYRQDKLLFCVGLILAAFIGTLLLIKSYLNSHPIPTGHTKQERYWEKLFISRPNKLWLDIQKAKLKLALIVVIITIIFFYTLK